MVEFALVFLIFILLVLGVMEGGRMIWAWTTLAHAVQEGARFAIMRAGQADIDTDIANLVKSRAIGLPRDDVSVATTWNGTSGGGLVSITATYNLPLMFTTMVFGSSTITLKAESAGVIVEK